MTRTRLNENDLSTLRFALRIEANHELDGICAKSGAQAAQYRKLVRLGLLEYAGMGETDDGRHLPVALYNITDQGKALLDARAKPITLDEVKQALAEGAKESAAARRLQKRSPRR